MSNVIRNLLIKVGADFTDAQKGFTQASRNLKKAGRQMQNTGRSLTKGLTVPVVAAVAGLASMTVKAAQTADELNTLANKTGLTTDALQEMDYASRFIDVSLETMTGSMIKLTKNMDLARTGTKEQREAFEMLGVAYKNTDGTLRNAKDVWYDAIDALGKVSNEAERDAMALRLFGRSAAELNPLIKAGSSELKRLGIEAHDVGAVMSGENIDSLQKFNDQLDVFKAQLKTSTAEIGAAFLPVLQKLTPVVQNKIIPAIQKFAGWLGNLITKFETASPAMKNLIKIVGLLAVGIGPLLTVAGKLVSVVGSMVGAFGAAAKAMKAGTSAITAFAGPVGIAAVAIATLIAAIVIANSKTSDLAKELKNLNKEIENNRNNYEKAATEIQANETVARNLTDRLYELEAIEKKTNAEKSEMIRIVDQLNNIMPDLNLQIDENTWALKQNKTSVLEFIAAKVKQLKVVALEEALTEAYKQQAQAIAALDKANADHDLMLRSMTEGTKDFTETELARWKALSKEIATNNLAGALSKLNTVVKDGEQAVLMAGYNVEYYEGKLADLGITSIDVADDIVASSGDISDALAEQAQSYEEYYKSIDELAKEHLDFISDITDGEIEKIKLTASQWKKILDKRTEDFKKWSDNLRSLSGRVPDAMLEDLRNLGPEYANLIAEFATMTDTALQPFVNSWKHAAAVAYSAALSELSASKGLYLGEQFIQGIIDGFEAKGSSAVSAAARAAQKVKEAVSKSWVIQSPSKAARRLGALFSEGLGLGIDDGGKNVLKRAGGLARDVIGRLTGSPSFTPMVDFSMGGLTPAFAGGDVNDMLSDQKIVISPSDVYINMNGREVAKATVNFTDKLLQDKTRSNLRAGGK